MKDLCDKHLNRKESLIAGKASGGQQEEKLLFHGPGC